MKRLLFYFVLFCLVFSCARQVRSIEDRAADGEPEAQYKLAVRYLDTLLFSTGEGRYLSEGVNLLKLSAEQGNSDAQCKLGNSYLNGFYGLPQDFEKGLELLFLSADQGTPEAEFVIALCYHTGQAVAQDYNEAIVWYKRVENHHAQLMSTAQVNIGICHACMKNYEEAVRWYRKAAESGLPYAQFLLGMSFLNGEGVIKDKKEAEKWIRQAAEQGNEYAKIELKKL